MVEILERKNKEIACLKHNMKILEEHIVFLNRKLFGKKKETIIDDGNYLPMDLEPPALEKEEPVQEELKKVVKKKRKKFSRFNFPDDAPREEEVFDLSEEEKEGLKYIGSDIVEKLAYRPGNYFIKVIITKKYAKLDKPELGIFIPEKPQAAIPGSRIDESMLATILVDKYCDHLPLYRLEQKYARDGLYISRKTLSALSLKAGSLIEPLAELLLKEIMASQVIFTDDSTVSLQQKGGCKTSRLWVYAGGASGDPPLIYYQFTKDRKEIHSLRKFENYKGIFHSDIYSVYEKIAKYDDITWQPCWAHARRKFFEALTNHSLKGTVLQLMDDLFMHERKVWEVESSENTRSQKNYLKLKIRKEECLPIVDNIFNSIKESVKKGEHRPKEKLTLAIAYLLKREDYFKNFLKNPDIRIDNNVSERNIRPLAIGRKNWLFVGSEKGGQTLASVMSLVQTCKNLNINPREYLEDVLKKINNTPKNLLTSLLPQNFKKIQ